MHWFWDGLILVTVIGSALCLRNLRAGADQSPKQAFRNLSFFAVISMATCFALAVWSLVRTTILPSEAGHSYQVVFAVIFVLVGAGFLAILGKGMFSKWETRLFCSHCGKFIAHETRWVCGFCDVSNDGTLYRACENCEQEPKAYRCHHCGKPIFLGTEHDENHIAHAPSLPPPLGITEQDVARQRQAEKERREHELVIIRLDAQLAEEKKRMEMLTKKKESPREALEADLSEHKTHFLSVDEMAQRELDDAERKFPNNPDMRERYKEVIESWKARHL